MPDQRGVVGSDGVRLAVYVDGPPDAPAVLAVHGYPDDHTVWDGVTELLADTMRVVRYDVRGAGASDSPSGRRAYRLDRLVDDLVRVLDTVDGRVSLLGHDWGSVQAWAALADPRVTARVTAFTSVSGPSLEQAARWLLDVRAHPGASLRQLAHSYYTVGFQVPFLPEAAVRAGIIDRAARHTSRRDQLHGLALYRANLGRVAGRTDPKRIAIPVQVIAPRDDPYILPELATEAPVPWVGDLRTRVVPGRHWIVRDDPALIATAIRDLASR